MTSNSESPGYRADKPVLSEANRQLMDAATRLDLESIQQAIRDGANVNALDDGETALTFAVMAYPWEKDKPNDPDGYDKSRDYPLEIRLHVIDWLIAHGADINLFGKDSLAPLSMAVLHHDPELVRQILIRGADPTSDQFPDEPPYGPTAADYAGGDLNVVDKNSSEYVDVWEIAATVDAAIIDWRMARGASLREILANPYDGELWLTRTDAAYMVALAWNRLDPNLLEPHLADSVVYESQHVLTPLQGKPNVLDYLSGKMKTIHEDENACVLAEIGVSHLGPSVILRQGCDLSTAAVLLIDSNDGKIDRIDACGIAPHPESIRRTEIFPCGSPGSGSISN